MIFLKSIWTVFGLAFFTLGMAVIVQNAGDLYRAIHGRSESLLHLNYPSTPDARVYAVSFRKIAANPDLVSVISIKEQNLAIIGTLSSNEFYLKRDASLDFRFDRLIPGEAPLRVYWLVENVKRFFLFQLIGGCVVCLLGGGALFLAFQLWKI